MHKKQDAILTCKSSGIIPYTFLDGKLLFLLQKQITRGKTRNYGWNDFGGKKNNSNESLYETACREFSEETNCLFYLKSNDNPDYNDFTSNNNDEYTDFKTKMLRLYIGESIEYFKNRLNNKMSAYSNDTYITFFMRVEYINENEFPESEDMHIKYQDRYKRICKWFCCEEILNLDDLHKRLQIVNIKSKIDLLLKNGYFC